MNLSAELLQSVEMTEGLTIMERPIEPLVLLVLHVLVVLLVVHLLHVLQRGAWSC